MNLMNQVPGNRQQPSKRLESCVGHGLVVFGDGGLVLGLARHHQANEVLGELLLRLKNNIISRRIWKLNKVNEDNKKLKYGPYRDVDCFLDIFGRDELNVSVLVIVNLDLEQAGNLALTSIVRQRNRPDRSPAAIP